MDLSNILVIAGKSDLFELVSQTKTGAIVESLADHKRFPVFKNDRISSLNEISMFTTEKEEPLRNVMRTIYKKEDGKAITFEIKKGNSADLFAYFKEILPNYDTEHVYASDVKKVYLWYNQLVAANKIDLEDPEAKTEE